MYKKESKLVFSPSDLTTFWESEFGSWMDRCRIECPERKLVPDEDQDMMKLLQKKGYTHEDNTIALLEREGRRVLRLDDGDKDLAAKETIEAIKSGHDVIFQARLELDPFAGFSDFLVKQEGTSKLGDFYYEIWDTKLAGHVKPYFVLQLCAYAEMLKEIQGILPPKLVVALGNGERISLQTEKYFYYYLAIKRKFLEFHKNFDPDKRPNPEKYRSFGRWEGEAKKHIEEHDALSQVAGISRGQIKSLNQAGILSMADLAKSSLKKVPKIGDQVFEKLKNQSRIQTHSKGHEVPKFELLPKQEGLGLYLLPAHSENDVFFDIEGFPLVPGGLEYLWGNTILRNGELQFVDFWAHDRVQEKKAFEDFIDWIYQSWQKDPCMHVYHYASYEITAIKKLMGRYATREFEVDQLLRHEVFVDLYKIVKQALLVGEPRYSIKNIEHLYRGKRDTNVADGGASVVFYEIWLEKKDGETWKDSKLLNDLREYNIDDCNSTYELTMWLRKIQREADISPRDSKVDEGEKLEEAKTEDKEIVKIKAILEDMSAHNPEALILRDLVEFYDREQKPVWWKYFDRLQAESEQLFLDLECIASLSKVGEGEPLTKTRHKAKYKYDPRQDVKLKSGDKGINQFEPESSFTIETIDYKSGEVSIGCSNKIALPEEFNFIAKDIPIVEPLKKALKAFIENWIKSPNAKNCVIDFLKRMPPRIQGRSGGALSDGGDVLKDIISCAENMDHTTLCIQGPPGAGKTYTAEHVIAHLIKKGKRVGITSNSHKAINNLLVRANKKAKDGGLIFDSVKVKSTIEDDLVEAGIKNAKSGNQVKVNDELKLLGGTAWAFASDSLVGSVDYLFIDEAGQVSIANILAMSLSCKNIILMGDQMQLSQPIQGNHPGDSGMSALDYLLGKQATIAEDMGFFLPKTFRMHPDVCGFISSMVYDGRLKSAAQTENQLILSSDQSIIKKQSGIIFHPVEHEGNSQYSQEEVEHILSLYRELLQCSYQDEKKNRKEKLTEQDILVVAPYNFQVNKLQEALGSKARVGTVDRFQGQEAPVVLLSMTASDGESVPRGLDFLLSTNRLNVAISRAQALAIVVGSPELQYSYVGNSEMMELVNFYCRLIDYSAAE